jgi:hypothetical protein
MLALILAKTCSIIDKILSQPVAVIDCPLIFTHHTTGCPVLQWTTNTVIPCSRVLPEKLSWSHSPHFMEPLGSLQCSKQPVTCPCPETLIHSTSSHPVSVKMHVNILQFTARSSTSSLYIHVRHELLVCMSSSQLHMPHPPHSLLIW